MDHVFAKEKGRLGQYAKLFSERNIYKLPEELENAVEYDAAYKLEENEWYMLSEFSTKDFCIDILKEPVDSTDYVTITNNVLKNLEYICAYQNENEFYFQRVLKSRLIKKHRIIDFTQEMKIRETGEGIIINDIPE